MHKFRVYVVCFITLAALLATFLTSWHILDSDLTLIGGKKYAIQPLPSNISMDISSERHLLSEYSNAQDLTRDDLLPSPAGVVNPHNYKYIINNPYICLANPDDKLDYVVYFHSAPENLDRRESLRQTWARPNILRGRHSRVVFFMGKPNRQLS